MVVLQTEGVPLLLELVGDACHKLFRSLAGGLGGAFHFLAMLVGAGGERDLEALHALEALDRVGRNRGVRVADMRRGVHVIDRSGQVVFHFEFFK